MDQRERIEQLKAEVQRLAAGQADMGGIDQLPPDVAVRFLERVIAVEKDDARNRKRDENCPARALGTELL